MDGDLTRPQTLDAACRGVEVVISTATSMPSGANDGLRRVDHDGNLALIAAAERAGVRKFVYVSYSGNIEQPSPLAVAKRGCEARLRNSSMQAVIRRPSHFAEVWLSPALGFDARNGKIRVYGPGTAKVTSRRSRARLSVSRRRSGINRRSRLFSSSAARTRCRNSKRLQSSNRRWGAS